MFNKSIDYPLYGGMPDNLSPMLLDYFEGNSKIFDIEMIYAIFKIIILNYTNDDETRY